jgi:adenine-specific DNA-methyltransferase
MLFKGDCLDCLRIIKNNYGSKIDCIYIDTPYNTKGGSFIYADRFYDHNEWLSFMYSRLLIARDVLSKDGVIFISIDDNEQAGLKLLCDEVFGENNFITMFLWNRTATTPNLSNNVRKKYEYILCYKSDTREKGLSVDKVVSGDAPLIKENNREKTLTFDKDAVKFGISGYFKAGSYGKVELVEDIEIENGRAKTDLKLRGRFAWIQSTLAVEIECGTTFYVRTNKFAIRYERNNLHAKTPSNIINRDECEVGTNEEASSELEKLFGSRKIFDFPKPVSLIKYLVNMIGDRNATVLDFFAGSGTTGQAVAELNAEDDGDRNFILFQSDEPISPKRTEAYDFCFKNSLPAYISSITQERLRRAGLTFNIFDLVEISEQ